MDQLSAHLDRGWDLVQRGDLKGARASARRALETEKESPEAHNLLGFVAAQEGDSEEALEHYRQAMALDDGYIDPMLPEWLQRFAIVARCVTASEVAGSG